MIKKFYVDIDQLGSYADFLKKTMNTIIISTNAIGKANMNLQSLVKDKVTAQIDEKVKNLRKIYSKFSLEVNNLSKNVKEDQQLYSQYNKGLKRR